MRILIGLTLLLGGATPGAAENERQKIPVPKPFVECKADAQCETTVELCGCCQFIAMNAKFVKKYAALERYCKDTQTACQCTPPSAKPKCVKKLCKLVPNK